LFIAQKAQSIQQIGLARSVGADNEETVRQRDIDFLARIHSIHSTKTTKMAKHAKRRMK